MNDLELALVDKSNEKLNWYLEITPTADIRAHIEEIRSKEANRTDAGRIRERLRDIVKEFDV